MMFGLFRKKKSEQQSNESVDMNDVRVFYDGEVICGDYDVNNPDDYPFHNLFPHGCWWRCFLHQQTLDLLSSLHRQGNLTTDNKQCSINLLRKLTERRFLFQSTDHLNLL